MNKKEGLSDIQRDIVERVHSFCQDMLDGTLAKEVADRYNIPDEYLSICRDLNHPSCEKLNARLFQYIMERIGYYQAHGDTLKIESIQSNLDSILEYGSEDKENKTIIMYPIKLGIKKTLESLVYLCLSQKIEFAAQDCLSDLLLSKDKCCFRLDFKRDYTGKASIDSIIDSIDKIFIEDRKFVVLKNGLTLRSRKINFIHPDEISLDITGFKSDGLQESAKYYFRYITEIDKEEDIIRLFGYSHLDIDGLDTIAIRTTVSGNLLLMYQVTVQSRHFLILEYADPITYQEMLDLSFATLVSFGMITRNIHLNDAWLVAYEDPGMLSETGVLYRSWIPTIHCGYEIFSTNVYSRLIPAAERHDPINGEQRMIKVIDHFKCAGKLQPLSPEVFGCLIENMRKYEELQRGIFIILMGSHYNLEVQAAIYCVAMEAITNLCEEITGPLQRNIVDKNDWSKVADRIASTLDALMKDNIINNIQREDLGKKLKDMNRGFNSEKLKSLLEFYQYPLSDFDKLTLSLRNPLLHGSISFRSLKQNPEEENLFQLSLNLHKLCCATALLMSGFNGYIVNNRNYYGFPNSGSAFIKIGKP